MYMSARILQTRYERVQGSLPDVTGCHHSAGVVTALVAVDDSVFCNPRDSLWPQVPDQGRTPVLCSTEGTSVTWRAPNLACSKQHQSTVTCMWRHTVLSRVCSPSTTCHIAIV